METAGRTTAIKTGSYTLALGLIALGAGILAANLGFLEIPSVLKFWPVLIIGLGVEYFIRKLFSGGREVQFSIPGTILVGLLALSAAAAGFLYGFAPARLLEEEFLSGIGPQYVKQWQGDPVELSRGSRLEVENRIGEIEIAPSPDGRLHLSARITARASSEEKARAAAEAQKINVETGNVTRVYTSQDRSTAVKLRLEVPEGLNISAVSNLGSISARRISAESLNIESDMGRVNVDEYTGSLKATGKLGEIVLREINGDCEAEASMGRIAITNPRGNVTATGGNGAISLDSDRPLDKKYVLRGDNGQVTLKLPRSSSLKIQASTGHGSISGLEIRQSSPGGSKRGDLTLGSGTGSALLETKNGAIRVDTIE